MTLLQALILGIIQGITEFLPVSSSAHLVLVPYLLGWNLTEEFIFPFDVLVQLGTLIALVVFFRKDLMEIATAVIRGIKERKPFEEAAARVGWLALVATIPAGLFGILIKDRVEAAFNSPAVTAVFLFATAALLVVSEYLGKRSRELDEITWLDALWIGAFQALAIFPGISRSGSTITGAMTHNFKRKPAGQFSFIIAIPVFLAAGVLGFRDLMAINNLSALLPKMLVGFLAAGIVGYFAIRWLLDYIAAHSLLPFAGYCVMLAAGTLAFSLINPAASVEPAAPDTWIKQVSVNWDSFYKVSIDPDLEWLLPAMVDCQRDLPFSILFSQKKLESGKPLSSDLALAYGEFLIPESKIFHIASDVLAVSVHPTNPLQLLTPELAEGIFSGKIRTWEAAAEACPDCLSAEGITAEIDLYSFTPGSVVHESTRNWLANGKPLSSAARLAPNARAIRQALGQDTQAIAALPYSWVDATIKTITVETPGIEPPAVSVLAYSGKPLDETQKAWLACVQTRIK